jgi:hypothetical protein
VGTPALDGNWVLADVRCASGPLGELGARIAEPVHTRALEEVYEVDNGAFTWRVRERTPGADQNQYCETVLTGTWTADGKTLRSSGATFQSRNGVHGYKCYEPFQHPKAEASHELGYELGHDRLQIHHKNPRAVMKDHQGHERVLLGCETGSDLLYFFERELGGSPQKKAPAPKRERRSRALRRHSKWRPRISCWSNVGATTVWLVSSS